MTLAELVVVDVVDLLGDLSTYYVHLSTGCATGLRVYTTVPSSLWVLGTFGRLPATVVRSTVATRLTSTLNPNGGLDCLQLPCERFCIRWNIRANVCMQSAMRCGATIPR
jgi:hypothetical protein